MVSRTMCAACFGHVPVQQGKVSSMGTALVWLCGACFLLSEGMQHERHTLRKLLLRRANPAMPVTKVKTNLVGWMAVYNTRKVTE